MYPSKIEPKRDYVLRLREGGMSIKKIAREIGVCEHSLNVWFWKKTDWPKRIHPNLKERHDEIESLVKAGVEQKEIAERLNCSVSSIQIICSKHGWRRPHPILDNSGYINLRIAEGEKVMDVAKAIGVSYKRLIQYLARNNIAYNLDRPCGKDHHRWKGGYVHRNLYRFVFPKEDWIKPVAYRDGRMPEHRYVMTKHLCRLLQSKEIVHHLDGNRVNNDIANLHLFPSQKRHCSFHATCMNMGIEAPYPHPSDPIFDTYYRGKGKDVPWCK